MNILDRCSVPLELKFADGDTEGRFSGYAAFFNNVDSYGDVIEPGAFGQSLKEWGAKGKLPPMLLQHGGGMFGGAADDMVPIGVWESMKEDANGLRAEGRLLALDTDRGKAIHAAMKARVLDGLSIGFMVRTAVNGTKPGEPDRRLTEIDLWEASIVTFPANPKARITNVKAMADQIRDQVAFEKFLRQHGFANALARRLAAGWNAAVGRQDDDEAVKELARAIRASAASLIITSSKRTQNHGPR